MPQQSVSDTKSKEALKDDEYEVKTPKRLSSPPVPSSRKMRNQILILNSDLLEPKSKKTVDRSSKVPAERISSLELSAETPMSMIKDSNYPNKFDPIKQNPIKIEEPILESEYRCFPVKNLQTPSQIQRKKTR